MGLPYANRKQRRQAHSLERRTGGVLVDPAELESLHRMQTLFVAMVKDQVRVRVSEKTLAELTPNDRITSRTSDGFVMLTYVPADKPAEGDPA